VLRRQVRRDFRKPLVIMTPKSLLRNDKATSRIEDFTEAAFQQVLGPNCLGEPDQVSRLIFCSGKVYYDLANYLETNRVTDAALVRLEQLYPLSLEGLEDVINGVRFASKWVWCQEEPRNMGAWTYIAPLLAKVAGQAIEYAGRPPAASPAVGSKAWHDQQQKELVHQAFSM
jgi:2-oxoglutarate dehydrogenase E1 component